MNHPADRDLLFPLLRVGKTEGGYWHATQAGLIVLAEWARRPEWIVFTIYPWPLKPDVLMTLKEIFPTMEQWHTTPEARFAANQGIRGNDRVMFRLIEQID